MSTHAYLCTHKHAQKFGGTEKIVSTCACVLELHCGSETLLAENDNEAARQQYDRSQKRLIYEKIALSGSCSNHMNTAGVVKIIHNLYLIHNLVLVVVIKELGFE